MVRNVVRLARTATFSDLPIILTAVNVETGLNKPTIQELQDVLESVESYGRTSLNAWEGKGFREAVQKAGRRKLFMSALWIEACLPFPRDGRDEGRLRGLPGGEHHGRHLQSRARRRPVPPGTEGRQTDRLGSGNLRAVGRLEP